MLLSLTKQKYYLNENTTHTGYLCVCVGGESFLDLLFGLLILMCLGEGVRKSVFHSVVQKSNIMQPRKECLEWFCSKDRHFVRVVVFPHFSYLWRNLCKCSATKKELCTAKIWKMGPVSSSLYKTNLPFQGRRGLERNEIFCEVILYPFYWKSFCCNETDPRQAKRTRCTF